MMTVSVTFLSVTIWSSSKIEEESNICTSYFHKDCVSEDIRSYFYIIRVNMKM